MIVKYVRLVIAIVLLQLSAIYSYGQENTAAINTLIKTIGAGFEKLPSEKLYIHFDKPYYTVGDTIWFKSYLLTSAANTASALSSKLYVELINDTSKVVTRLVIPLSAGLGQGYFALNNIYDGSYKIRAYTNWMQNVGEASFFYKLFYIGKPTQKGGWLINEQHTIKATDKGNQVSLALQLKDMGGNAIPYRDVEFKLLDGRKTLIQANKITSDGGIFNSQFTLAEKVDRKNLTLLITDRTGKNSKLAIPFYPGGSAQNIDLQFMPEGGAMVSGLYNKVGFKIIGEDGKGLAVKGIIRNSKNEEVIAFQSLHNGMGSFMLLPQQNETYSASIITPGGFTKVVALPVSKPMGTALRVDNTSRTDSLNLYITATPDLVTDKPFTLIAQTKDAISFGTFINLNKGFYNLRIAKTRFKTGIVSFVLLNDQNKPLNERRVFINRNDQLKLEISNNKNAYQPKDSVAINLNVTDKYGKPVQGSFSVSVTDDDALHHKEFDNNIYSQFLLSSEIRGYMEEAAWYFLSNNKDKEKALDNLMLTQGWTGYDWAGPLSTSSIFEAETDNSVSGRLLNSFKNPIKNAQVMLYASTKKYGTIVIDTTSDIAGKFRFSNLPMYDTIAYTIKAHSSKGKSLGAIINIDEFKPSPISLKDEIRAIPWYAQTSDSLMMKYFNRPNQPVVADIKPSEIKGKLLNEVQIKAKKQRVTIGDEDGFPIKELNEKELINARKKSLLSLLFEKFNSFRESYIFSYNAMDKPEARYSDIKETISITNFCLGTSLIYDVFVDGQSMKRLNGNLATQDSTTYHTALKEFFTYVAADDIKEVKIMGGYHTFMTITTRSGAGPLTRISHGNTAYRPLPMLPPKQFYSPRYTVKDTATPRDHRTTIYWEPNVITDENGKATLSFYAADKLSTYSIYVEGTDMVGGIGYQTGKISVTSKATASK